MRHYKKGRKLGTDKSHTKAMKRNLVSALFLNDRIKTVEARAKEIRGDVDKIIGWAKKGDLHSRRLAIAALGGDKYLVQEIFEKVEQGMFKERNSGYTRIVKLGVRKGDNSKMVLIELINEGKKKSTSAKDDKKKDSKKSDKKEEKDAVKKEEKKEDKQEDKKEDKKDVNAEEDKEKDSTEEKTEKKDESKEELKKEDKPKEESKKEDESKEEPKKEDESKEETKKEEDEKEESKKEESKEEK